jgi:methylmalonyl-CoA mutase N-terminal domain/subunit
VNCHTEGNDEDPPETLYIDSSVEELQRKRLESVKSGRDSAAVDAVLARLRTEAADPELNLMPTLIDAAHSRATLGEVIAAMGSVFGWWDESPVI